MNLQMTLMKTLALVWSWMTKMIQSWPDLGQMKTKISRMNSRWHPDIPCQPWTSMDQILQRGDYLPGLEGGPVSPGQACMKGLQIHLCLGLMMSWKKKPQTRSRLCFKALIIVCTRMVKIKMKKAGLTPVILSGLFSLACLKDFNRNAKFGGTDFHI